MKARRRDDVAMLVGVGQKTGRSGVFARDRKRQAAQHVSVFEGLEGTQLFDRRPTTVVVHGSSEVDCGFRKCWEHESDAVIRMRCRCTCDLRVGQHIHREPGDSDVLVANTPENCLCSAAVRVIEQLVNCSCCSAGNAGND